ncbi:uncharacterized protein I303_107295 [Kwoniella dejecticola CBS 10117]|uniref:Uncharacterized protein n=1 Tax=Kwoniella dejecticola CBS 10117 TaxID=1296121 RepID=A0A1A5ZZ93_9TREE|nr:uncharacterized protein I303_06698 [Kwoniella dejecticola CBS 10117]OBR83139.1 hypothetical protein I303_06698 [Kwoniella dejecticola CBS 10117]
MESKVVQANAHPQSPLHLAAANDINSFAIDPSLEASSEFFQDPADQAQGHSLDIQDAIHQTHERGDENDTPTQADIDAVIKASLDHAQAQAAADAVAAAVSHLTDQSQDQTQIDPALAQDSEAGTGNQIGNGKGSGTGNGNGNSKTKTPGDKRFPDSEPGQEHNPIPDPPLHIAPFSRPSRTVEDTPLPLFLTFGSRPDFLRWLDAESSWCHFVQRRTTTPDKRSAERLQARIRAHERSLNAMTSEEREAATPLKTRRRKRVSPVFEKVTFTCHHAGSYESKHSTTLPEEKLRKNTKKSVKCACASRVVLSELQSGDCKVVYHWKHDGHDPFSDADLEGGRLPKSIDTWLNKQIEAGKTLDDIRKILDIPEEEKEAYLAKVRADPTALDPNMPPPLAMALKVKYPDIYNRYRKLKGPVKEHKQLKGPTKRTASGTTKPGSGSRSGGRADTSVGEGGGDSETGISNAPTPPTVSTSVEPDPLHGLGDLDPLMTHHGELDGLTSSLIPPYSTVTVDHAAHDGINGNVNGNGVNGMDSKMMIVDGQDEHNEVDTEFAQLASSHDLLHHHPHHQEHQPHQDGNAIGSGDVDGNGSNVVVDELINSHEGLARALLDLPSAGLRDEDGNEMSLEEAMRRMAEGVAQVAAQEQRQSQSQSQSQGEGRQGGGQDEDGNGDGDGGGNRILGGEEDENEGEGDDISI